MDKPEKLEMQSADGVQLNLDALYQIAPSCFTEAADPKTGKVKRMVNFDTLRQLLGDDTVEDAPEAYEFNWVGKQAARAEVLQPIKKTLRPVKEDSVDWDNTQNLYIEGDNLEVLKLLQKSYLGKIKMIYIDPPYNTGNDFVYHDDFARTQEEEDLAAGNIDELGNRYIKNTDSNGKYHSDWCSMMYARLMVARTLLSEDGVIFISIDENEEYNLANICREVFGENNFISTCVRRKNKLVMKGDKTFKNVIEPLLVYAKDKSKVTFSYKQKEVVNSDFSVISAGYGEKQVTFLPGELIFKTNIGNVLAGKYSSCTLLDNIDICNNTNTNTVKIIGEFKWSESKIKEKIHGNAYILVRDIESMSMRIYFQSQNAKPLDYIDEKYGVVTNEGGIQDLKKLGLEEYFSYPKPLDYIIFITNIINNHDALVLDFFSGSSTTAHAVMQINAEDQGTRKFIMVQLPEETPEDSEARKAGYLTIPEIAKERIRRAGKKIKEEHPEAKDLDTGFRVFRVDSSNFEDVEHTPKEWNQNQLDMFLNNIKTDRNELDLLFGCMLDWGVKLSLPMTSEEVDGKMIYTVNEGDLVACFAEKVTDNVVKAMADKNPLRVIFRDSCFDQDADKINIYETFKQLLDWTDELVGKNIRVI